MLERKIRDIVERRGVAVAAEMVEDLLTDEKHPLLPEQVSIRNLWEQLVGPTGQTLALVAKANRVGFVNILEAPVNTTAFDVITGQLIAKKVIAGYQYPPAIGDRLVTNYPSNRKTETIAGFTSVDGPEEVQEGQDYPESAGLGEKYVTTETKKKGRIISITEEMVLFDQTNQILQRARGIGIKCRLDKEKTILKAVMGIDQCYRPSGTATNLYTSAWEFLAANALADWTDIDNAEQQHANNVVDETGDVVLMVPRQQLVMPALKRTAMRISNATEVRQTQKGATDATFYETAGSNPVAGDYEILSSPIMVQLASAAGWAAGDQTGRWWLGDFPMQFFWQEIWPISVVKAKAGNEREFNADIAARFKVRYYGGCFAETNQYVIQNDPT
jgi:hypothetical protein